MIKKNIWIVLLIFHVFPDLSSTTKSEGLLVDARMNMNIMKMFDKFFNLRHRDLFFYENFKKYLNDEYLKKHFSNEFEITKALKTDISMQAIYLENTVWYSTSITELFSILYTKYLAASYIMKFINCEFYYTKGDENKVEAMNCRKVKEYLFSFTMIAFEKYMKKVQNLLVLILDITTTRQWHPYRNVFVTLNMYFDLVIGRVRRGNATLNVPNNNNKDEFLKTLLFQETTTMQYDRLYLKYFFRNIFFGTHHSSTPMKKNDFLSKKVEEEKKVLSKKSLHNIRNETIAFWKIAGKIVDKIEKNDPLNPKAHHHNTEKDNFIVSNITKVLRILEIQKLLVNKINIENQQKFKRGSENEIFQLFADPGNEFGQQLQYMPLETEKFDDPPIAINDYPQIDEQYDDADFSIDVITKLSDENYGSAKDLSFKSATDESARLIHSKNNSSVLPNHPNHQSEQFTNKSQMDPRQVYANMIRRKIEQSRSVEISARSAEPASKRNSQASDFSHLKNYMASDNSKMKTYQSSSYQDVSRSTSQSVHWDHSIPNNNMASHNRVSHRQLIDAF